MTFALRRLVFGTKSALPIDRARFDDIRNARNALLALLGVEEKFDLVLECYREFEEALLSIGLSDMMYGHVEWSRSIDTIQLINRRLVAFLSAGRLYEEQLEHDVRGVYGRHGAQTGALVAEIDRANKEDTPFRIVDALRNYVQHRSLPVHNLSTHWQWEGDSDEDSRRCVHTIDPQIDTDRLKGDRRFDQALLEGVHTIKGKTNIRPLIQAYLATLGRFHKQVRELSDLDLAQWERALFAAEDEFVNAFGEGSVGLAAVREEEGIVQESVYVFTEPLKRRRMLRHKNDDVSHYARHIVTNASRTDV